MNNYTSNKASGRIILYKDVDKVDCRTHNKFDSIDDFILWCKESGVTKYDTFTEIRLDEEYV